MEVKAAMVQGVWVCVCVWAGLCVGGEVDAWSEAAKTEWGGCVRPEVFGGGGAFGAARVRGSAGGDVGGGGG